MCAFLLPFCALLAWPVSNQGYLDDFSYAHTALRFAQTGHIIYNAWAGPTQGWMIVWGALFVRLFGFSFNILRIAMLILGMLTIFLFHRILLRFGLPNRSAVLGTLTLGLSPLFLPLSFSFMTDVPGTFALLLCVYMCQRAIAAADSRQTIWWLIAAASVNLASGTARQTAWLGALVMVPSTGWLLRSRRGVFPISTGAALVSVGAVFWLTRWFASRPNAWTDLTTAPGTVHHYLRATVFEEFVKLALCLALLLLPCLAAIVLRVRRLPLLAYLRGGLVITMLLLCLRNAAGRDRLKMWVAPWLYCTLGRYPEFGKPPIDQLFGSSVRFAPWIGVALAVVTVAVLWLIVEQLFGSPLRQPTNAREWSAFWIFGPYSLVYLLLLFPRADTLGLYDRYELGLMPVAIALVLLAYQRISVERVPLGSFAVLAVFALYGIADAHDCYADERAGDAAVQQLMQHGVPRTAISLSENSDAWLQVSIVGRMHWTGPAELDGGPPVTSPKPMAVPCSTYVSYVTPVVQPRYFVVFAPSSCLDPAPFAPVEYRAWLPPFRRREYIEQPRWLKP